MIETFLHDRNSPAINDHSFSDNLSEYRSFGFADVDIRIIYRETKDHFVFMRVGAHNQLYN